jgi:hypothetical protein
LPSMTKVVIFSHLWLYHLTPASLIFPSMV